MALLKNGALTEDSFTRVGADDPLPEAGGVIVPLARWREDRGALLARGKPLGVQLQDDEPPSEIESDLEHFAVIALTFPAFKNGRGYSSATLLRKRFGYKGEIRAVGDVLRDQFAFMARCGIDALEVDERFTEGDYADALAELSLAYQAAADGRASVLEMRAAARGKD